MALQIHPVTGSSGVRAALDLYIEDEDREQGWRPGQPPVQHNEAVIERDFKHWLGIYESTPEGFIFAEDDQTGQIVGVAAAVRRPPQWILTNFYVHADYQGRGIGRRLLECAFAAREGCDRFCVHASSHPAAQALYMKFGMYPQPHSIQFKGRMTYNIGKPKHVNLEKVAVSHVMEEINWIDQHLLGFERPTDHLRWGTEGHYYLVRTKDARKPFAYFRVAESGEIGPAVVMERRWRRAVLEMSLMVGKDLAEEQTLLVPGANSPVIERLLAYGYRIDELHLFLSNVPMPGLAQVIFHDTDLL
jgi:GNAT superfamily N-acetyltransferase